MSYHLRFERSGENGGAWNELELRQVIPTLEGFIRVTNDNGPNFGFQAPSGNEVWLHYHDGDLWGERIGPDQIPFLVELAEKLNARLIGDENETYLPGNRVIADPEGEVRQLGWRKFFRRYGHIIVLTAFFAAVLVLRAVTTP